MALLFIMATGFGYLCSAVPLKLDSASLWAKIISLENRIWADFPQTFKEAELVLKEANFSESKRCKGRALMMVGKFYWANGQYNQGLDLFRQSISIAQSINDYDTWSKATDLIANTYYYQAYYDSAEFYFQKAYQLAEKVNDLEGMILILHNTSLMYHRKGDFKRTIEYIFKGEKIKDKLPQSEHHIEAMGAMGSLMIDTLYYKEEIIDELKNLRHYTEKNDLPGLYNTYHNLGKAHRQLEEYQLAARYFVKACQVMQKQNLIPEWDLAATDYRDANMKDSCFYYHHLAKQEINRTTQPNVAYTLELLGDAHMYFKQYDSARYYYEKALKMSYLMNNRITFTGIHRSLVRTYTFLGDFDKAEYHLITGLNLAKEVALIHEKNLINEGKFLYELKGDYKKALYYSEKFKQYLDSINRQETAINLTRMQAEFKTEKRERELNEMRQLNLLNEEKIKTRTLQAGLAFLSMLLIGSFGIFNYSRFRQKKKSSEQLQRQNHIIEHQYGIVQKQNEEKEALLHEIHHRVKNNLQIISSLISIKSRNASEETKELLTGLNNRIHSLGLIHEMLYKSDHLGSVNLKDYLIEQSQLTLSSLATDRGSIELRMQIEHVQVNLDFALALGLISNELITNAIKYAFTATQSIKIINVNLQRTIENYIFSITDNGEHNPFDLNTKKSFGLRFVEQLVKSKLNGELRIIHEQGLRVEVILAQTNISNE